VRPLLFLSGAPLALLLLLLGGCPQVWGPLLDDDDDSGAGVDDDDSTGGDDDDSEGPCGDAPGAEALPLDSECRVDLVLDEETDLQILWQFSEFPTDPCSREVMMTPLVVPLTDDDGDGQPSTGDQRAIIFNTFCGADYANDGRLRALKGDGSALLWSVLDEDWATQPDSALAAGDIDGDGWPEIVAVHEDGALEVEHAGAFPGGAGRGLPGRHGRRWLSRDHLR
jgi:hypothetical protein